ncbi:MAG TPA: hypothetical protein VH763_15485 [Gemmatimonadales bacterium]|jgi:hypothetical protein
MNDRVNDPKIEPADLADRGDSPLGPDDEPVTTGTLFLTMIILMVIAAIWTIVYLLLLNR